MNLTEEQIVNIVTNAYKKSTNDIVEILSQKIDHFKDNEAYEGHVDLLAAISTSLQINTDIITNTLIEIFKS